MQMSEMLRPFRHVKSFDVRSPEYRVVCEPSDLC